MLEEVLVAEGSIIVEIILDEELSHLVLRQTDAVLAQDGCKVNQVLFMHKTLNHQYGIVLPRHQLYWRSAVVQGRCTSCFHFKHTLVYFSTYNQQSLSLHPIKHNLQHCTSYPNQHDKKSVVYLHLKFSWVTWPVLSGSMMRHCFWISFQWPLTFSLTFLSTSSAFTRGVKGRAGLSPRALNELCTSC